MAETKTARPTIAAHGAEQLPEVVVDSYNAEITDDEGFIGDRASRRAFREIVERWRKPLRDLGEDPFGDEPSDRISKKSLDELLAGGHPEAAGVVHGAIEDFAQELAGVIRRFLKLKAWRGTERIVIGGGFRASRVGELAVGRTAVILKAEKIKVDLALIRHDPDEAGLIGAVHLAPAWMFQAHDAILAVDIGGTNIRVGVVRLNLKKADDLSKAEVVRFELWRHGDEKLSRGDAVERLVDMLKRLIGRADKDGLALAPFIGIGCPGLIAEDGSIERGAQNLPGNWESPRFNLPAVLHEAIPRIGDHEAAIVMHNDAVVQGLSQTPDMQDVDHWGVLTIGTGLGNARFTNRDPD
ncbi:ROK family protein [Rhodoplanes serenus]|uniref:ROK family protein n=1 Tax=Rhodoplanes serenus TaxID=200615 RepID=UPI000DAD73AF|nr:ROK family protein [Rhodoplanes serenus]RAI32365.1 glucokinase [Rhodoplanes serenus]